MEIKAKCSFDFVSIKALTLVSAFRTFNPKKRFIIISIFSFLLAAFLLFEILYFYEFSLFIFFLVLVFLYTRECCLHFLLPKIRYKALANMQNTINEYTFCEDNLKIHTISKECNGDTQIEYSLLVKVYETSDYLFLYQPQNQVFIVDKSTITDGTVEDIKNKLKSYVKKKYYICKY